MAAGGDPHANDTLYVTMRKLATATGTTVPCCSERPQLILEKEVLGVDPSSNGTYYSVGRLIAIAGGANIGCCQMPPLQIIGDVVNPNETIYVIGGEGGGIIGPEDGGQLGAE